MFKLFSRRATVALSAGAAMLAAGAALPAQASSVPGWRVAATIRAAAGHEVLFTSVDAVSARDGWSAGITASQSGNFAGLIRHWNGKSWTAVALPSKVARAWSRSLPVEPLVGASSPSDAWIFGGQTTGAYLRLNGSRWSLGHLPGTASAAQHFVQINAVRVFSRSNVWAFGETDNESSPQLTATPYAAHFNGARWTVTHVPGNSGIAAVSAASGASIWAVAGTGTPFGTGGTAGQQALLHWTPKAAWQQLPQPVLPAGSHLSGVAAESGKVIVGGSEPNGRKGRSPLQITWNGKTWSAPSVAGASPTKWNLAGLASDGRGGTWVLGFHAVGDPAGKLWHVTAGKWAAVQPNFGKHAWFLEQIVAVPQTDSVWGVGALREGKSAAGLMAVAGPTPR